MLRYSLKFGSLKQIKNFSTTACINEKHKCKVLVVGGGSGGCTVAAKLTRKLNKNEVIVIEPSDVHYYQPMFTLIGGGIKTLAQSFKQTSSVLPKNAKWIKNSAAKFNPESNEVTLNNGDVINYDFMLVAVGLQLNYEKIPGLVDALSIPNGKVCSNYSPKYVERTYKAIQNFQKGNAIFTFPEGPVKCPGAPQKILYLAEHYFRKHGKRSDATVIYNTSLPVIFGVKKYADVLWKVVKERDIKVNLRTNLIEVNPDKDEAVFKNLDSGEISTIKYTMLHVTPPMSAPTVLQEAKTLTNEMGFLDVNKDTLQHNKFKNVFGIGDCSSSPNSKTAASIAAQSNIVYKNMLSVMKGKSPKYVYDGYASCPLVIGYDSCIMAEFNYALQPMETFPFMSQNKGRRSMLWLKRDFMSPLYWKLMLNGYWNGPAIIRETLKKIIPYQAKP